MVARVRPFALRPRPAALGPSKEGPGPRPGAGDRPALAISAALDRARPGGRVAIVVPTARAPEPSLHEAPTPAPPPPVAAAAILAALGRAAPIGPACAVKNAPLRAGPWGPAPRAGAGPEVARKAILVAVAGRRKDRRVGVAPLTAPTTRGVGPAVARWAARDATPMT